MKTILTILAIALLITSGPIGWAILAYYFFIHKK